MYKKPDKRINERNITYTCIHPLVRNMNCLVRVQGNNKMLVQSRKRKCSRVSYLINKVKKHIHIYMYIYRLRLMS
jgi:hypothetical protein